LCPSLTRTSCTPDDFDARSPDELSLAKGDRLELIERDDDFGDGWYLGKHIISGKTGLFPEVYTTSVPKAAVSFTSSSFSNKMGGPLKAKLGQTTESPSTLRNGGDHSSASAMSTREGSPQTPKFEKSTGQSTPDNATPPPLNTSNSQPNTLSGGAPSTPSGLATQRNVSLGTMNNQHAHGEDSPVINETLSVIDEHITDMSTPRHSITMTDGRGTNDSGSDYSTPLDPRLSYITGHETDEEEGSTPSEIEVLKWSPKEVAEYLRAVGVEKGHCEVFVDEEFSGEVLLGMDQASLLIKELDLGPVGRRLRTWQKIKALQDDVKGVKDVRRSSTGLTETGGPLEDLTRSRGNTGGTVLPRIPSLVDQNGSKSFGRSSRHQISTNRAITSPRLDVNPPPSPLASNSGQNSPRRPSAASVRELNHSRRHSSIDVTREANGSSSLEVTTGAPHKKQPSFDRNWTMGGAISTSNARPSSAGIKETINGHRPTNSSDQTMHGNTMRDSGHVTTTADLDRGYFSGGELENRKIRNVLRKRDSARHSRNSSYTDEQRLRSSTFNFRQSRLGSADSTRSNSAYASPSVNSSTPHRPFDRVSVERHLSRDSNSIGPLPSPKDIRSPASNSERPFSGEPKRLRATDNDKPASSTGPRLSQLQTSRPNSRPQSSGVRAISEGVTPSEKSDLQSSQDQNLSSTRDSPVLSPTPTGSSTPSVSKSFDTDSADHTKPSSTTSLSTPTSATTKRKTKRDTSAYTRGLEMKTPKEQMINCDYSGWMKKKNSNLMTTWKPRLFVLRGRRLSYYYSENDDEEKGLIDISSHRVLPAHTDRITGLHATLTGVTNSPTSPQHAQMPTIAATDAAKEPSPSSQKASADSTFIFKLVPPRAGLSRAVNFTKPTVHYFAVDNVKQGRLWMAALMKATIDRDDSKPMATTYQQKTISLAKARQQRHRPPALMGLDEKVDEEVLKSPASDRFGQNRGTHYDAVADEGDGDTPETEGKTQIAKKSQSLNAGFTPKVDFDKPLGRLGLIGEDGKDEKENEETVHAT
ncbi:MAG: polar growth protein, partial [Piccolia ochrophora]